MRVLLSATAAGRIGERVAAVDPSVEVVVMRDDGSLDVSGVTVEWGEAGIDVAYASADLFVDGGPKHQFIECIESSPSIRWLQAPAAGTNHPMYPTMLRKGARVTNAHVAGIAIAEYVIRAALDQFQDAPGWRQLQADRVWKRRRWRELYHTTWLIVGVGSIGSEVAKRARVFEAFTIGVRRTPTGQEPVDEMITPDELLDAVPRADVIVISAPATSATKHLVDREFLDKTREGSLLINVARGALVDEDALIAALDRGRPEAAVLDVASQEPLPTDSPLWSHPKVSLTPHNSALGNGGGERAADLFLANLASFVKNGPLENELTLEQVLE